MSFAIVVFAILYITNNSFNMVVANSAAAIVLLKIFHLFSPFRKFNYII